MTPVNQNFPTILEQMRSYKKMKTNKPFWNVEKDGSEGGIQADTLEQAQEIADQAFETEMLESGENLRNGEERDEAVIFIKYEYDPTIDDYKETQRIEGVVTYEHYHGDREEHGNYGL